MPVLNEHTIRFDGIESALHERLGRRPDIVELVTEYLDKDETGLMGGMISVLAKSRAPKQLIYAYMRTTRILWPFNFDTVSSQEQAEWKESIDRYFSVHSPDQTRPSDEVLDGEWRRAWDRTLREMKKMSKGLRSGRGRR
jgi:hypothetical protein